MSLPVATQEALELTKGDTVTWTQTYSDYPANDGWTLTYYLRGPGAFDVVASASGSDYLVTITAATTADWVVGRYYMVGVVTKTTQRKQVYSGQVVVREDPSAQQAGLDARSHARRCLEAIEAVLEGRASRSDQTYQIAGRSVSHYSFEELLKMRDYYAALVAKEDEAVSGNTNKYIYARFREWR